jgi:hypothetical protein
MNQAHLYTTKYKPATNTKPEMIEVYYDLMRKPVAQVFWSYTVQPIDNHYRAVVEQYLRDTNPRTRVVSSGECLNGYWFAVEEN